MSVVEIVDGDGDGNLLMMFPGELYDEINLNWLGCIILWLLIFTFNGFFLIGRGLFCFLNFIFHIGRKN